MYGKFLRVILKVFGLLVLSLCCVGCAADVVSPTDYTQLLLGAKNLFEISVLLFNSPEVNTDGQAIARMYYGCYYIARLIYNNIKGFDGPSHIETWRKMPTTIKEYGEALKAMRVKYDYYPYKVTENELQSDLSIIYDNRDKFHEMIEKLKSSNTDPDYIKAFEENVSAVEESFNALIEIVQGKLQPNELPHK